MKKIITYIYLIQNIYFTTIKYKTRYRITNRILCLRITKIIKNNLKFFCHQIYMYN